MSAAHNGTYSEGLGASSLNLAYLAHVDFSSMAMESRSDTIGTVAVSAMPIVSQGEPIEPINAQREVGPVAEPAEPAGNAGSIALAAFLTLLWVVVELLLGGFILF